MSTPIENTSCQILNIRHVPKDPLLAIFSFLDLPSLLTIQTVCKIWNASCQAQDFFKNRVWTQKFGIASCKQLRSYIESKQLTADLTWKYTPLLQFLHRATFRIDEATIPCCVKSNPHYQELSRHLQKPFCHNGHQCFFIQSPTTICTIDPKTQENFSFALESDSSFTMARGMNIQKITCSGDFLFALNNDGNIIKWDVSNQKQVDWACTIPEIRHSEGSAILFYIVDDCIITRYNPMMRKCYIEAIPTHSCKSIDFFLAYSDEYPAVCAIDSNFIYLHNRDNKKPVMMIHDREKDCLVQSLDFPNYYVGKKYIYRNTHEDIVVLEKSSREKKGMLLRGNGTNATSSQGTRVSSELFEHQNFLISVSTIHPKNILNVVDRAFLSISIWDIEEVKPLELHKTRPFPMYRSAYTGSPIDIVSAIEGAISRKGHHPQ